MSDNVYHKPVLLSGILGVFGYVLKVFMWMLRLVAGGIQELKD
ncbi:MAG: hypothetical protein R2769_04910 [Saprospiraceae bacterium]